MALRRFGLPLLRLQNLLGNARHRAASGLRSVAKTERHCGRTSSCRVLRKEIVTETVTVALTLTLTLQQ